MVNLKTLKLPLKPSFWFEPASLVSALVILVCPAFACARDIDWESLNLSPQQESQIGRLESSWEKTHAEIGAQIERDSAELRALLPTGDTQRIRQLQTRITSNKMFLMNQSMDTFLKKRDTLTPAQRLQLQKMLPAKYHQ
jgi:Spy/CpxP family protein refolding chaperone